MDRAYNTSPSRKFFFVFLFLAMTAASLGAKAYGLGPKVVYGIDDRKDPYQVADAFWLERARSTGALFKSSDVLGTLPNGNTKLNTKRYRDYANLCSGEPFADQQTGAFCSGSLVGDDLFLTAGHCITSSKDCAATKIVFDFGIWDVSGRSPKDVPSTSIYSCKNIVSRVLQSNGVDYAVIKLDRKVTDRSVLQINRANNLKVGDPTLVIGHPVGLPTKIAGGATVQSLERGFFNADLDTYGGNSGSPVFNEKTGLIEGILVRGAEDFIVTPQGCRVSNVCTNAAACGGGEAVTSISAASAFIP